MKYIKYYLSPITIALATIGITQGTHAPTLFFLGFSLFIILGDFILKNDIVEHKYSYPFLLNLPMYLNFPFLSLFTSTSIMLLSNDLSSFFFNFMSSSNQIFFSNIRQSLTVIDKISLVLLSGLYIGIMGTVTGHELVHRTKNKFDMFVGNWLLAFSWDCTFAVEHVYGHHKNVATPIDPATGKRGENIYRFVLRAIFKEHRDAWRIENSRLKLSKKNLLSLNNRMLVGYVRSSAITIVAYFIGGFSGMGLFLIMSFVAKCFLELINFAEHYGLVREIGQPVGPRHSWNSNATLSSLYLFNVTRHSSHHEKSHLKYWELKSYPDSPFMPYGYLAMLYLAIIAPPLFHRIMAKKLIDWDTNYATNEEKAIASEQNIKSGITLLVKSSQLQY